MINTSDNKNYSKALLPGDTLSTGRYGQRLCTFFITSLHMRQMPQMFTQICRKGVQTLW